jgi:hypothetical protein
MSVHDPLSKLDLRDPDLSYRGIVDDMKLWHTSDGDGVGLYYFDQPPDLPEDEASEETFRASYAERVPADVVEIAIEELARIPAVRTIIKVPQQPSGMTYLGSFIVPFRECSYVLKIQCEEHGVTGMREATLLGKGLASEDLTVDEDGGIGGHWAPDDAIHDDDFPDHPLSRCRRALGTLASSLSVAHELRQLPVFALPVAQR